MVEVILNEGGFEDIEAVHTYLADALAFPSYYGKNLAALSDCLGDISEPTIITVIRACEGDFDDELLDALGVEALPAEADEAACAPAADIDPVDWDEFTKLCRVLMRSARYNPSLHVMIVC